MDLDDTLAVFEDPAPTKKRTKSTPNVDQGSTRPASKRRLRYRPEVEVSGRRYKGRRVSRADIQLDREAIGLFDDDGIIDDAVPVSNRDPVSRVDGEHDSELSDESSFVGSPELGDPTSTGQESDVGDGGDSGVGDGHSEDDFDGPSGCDSGGKVSHDSEGLDVDGFPKRIPGDSSLDRNRAQLSAEQRVIMDRLQSVKKDDEDRATAVRFQKVSFPLLHIFAVGYVCS